MRKELPTVSEHSCSLSDDALQARVGQWRALTARALRTTHAPGTLTSVYPRSDEVAATVRALVEAEAECCSFLSFDVQERATEIEVELRYPDGFDIDAIFGRA